MKLFVLDTVPGSKERIDPAAPTVAWIDICHKPAFIFINHEPGRSPSRWTYVANKRPFVVRDKRWFKHGASQTLEGALRLARRAAIDMDGFYERI